MAVLLSDGRKNLKGAIHHILDTFITDMDCSRGIFIKPNIVFPVKPESGEITSPSFVKTLISALRERYSNIDIILGDGVAAGCDPQENFQVSGYASLAHELNVPLLDLHRVERKTVFMEIWKVGIAVRCIGTNIYQFADTQTQQCMCNFRCIKKPERTCASCNEKAISPSGTSGTDG